MQKEPIQVKGPSASFPRRQGIGKRGLLRAVPLRHSRLAKPWTIRLCLSGQLKRAVSQEMADAFFFQALKG